MEKMVQRNVGLYFILMNMAYFVQKGFNGSRFCGTSHRNKGVLPVALIEEMRQAFMRSEELLDLEMQGNGTKQEQANANKTSTQPTQMVVSLDQVETLISQGWRFVGTAKRQGNSGEKW
ncbi:MAG: hypothetical protein WBF38_07700 [Nitrosotalea sp.]